jgi:flagellar hook-basal body complex protein FliE
VDGIQSNISDSRLQLGRIGDAVKKAADSSSDSVGNVLGSFGDLLKKQMEQVNNLQAEADEAKQTYALGGEIELHNVILAAEKADLALQLTMQIRNKVIGAYQEITRMNI